MPVNPTIDHVASTVADPWIAGAIMLFVLSMLFLSLIARGEVHVAPVEDRLERLDIRMTAHESRLTLVEERQVRAENGQAAIRKDIARLPTKESVDKVASEVGEMRVEVRGINTQLGGTAHSVARIEDFLMKSAADVIVGRGKDA